MDANAGIVLGVDTLCWHARIESGRVGVREIVEIAARLGTGCVGINLHHLRDADLAEHRAIARAAAERGMTVVASGDFVGSACAGDSPSVGRDRVLHWLERAHALGSPYLRLASGFYRTDLAGRPDLIDAERGYVTQVLRRSIDDARASGIRLLLENHSDFTADEYVRIVEDVGADELGVFLDLVNPVAALETPEPVVRRLAPLAYAGHVKDYALRSLQAWDAYHRRGFEVLYRYPGEGVADLPALVRTLRNGLRTERFFLTIEGLDNTLDDDQEPRLGRALAHLRPLLES